MNELMYKQYRLLGKVTKTSLPNTDKIDLIKGTGLGAMKKFIANNMQLIEVFNSFTGMGFNLPDVEFEIDPPAVDIIPIAIYV